MRRAVNAGVYPQGVAWGFHTADEIRAAGARHVAVVWGELDAELDRFAEKVAA
jgi:phosphoglycolate phosphatase